MRRKRESILRRESTSRRVIKVVLIEMNINPESMMSSRDSRIGISGGKDDRVEIGKCKGIKTWIISILMKKIKQSNKEEENNMLQSKVVENGKNHLGRTRVQGWTKIYQDQ
jgi:hypothetical protein